MTPARFVAVSSTGAISNDKFALCEKLTAICRGYAVHKLGVQKWTLKWLSSEMPA
jgi:hypothetical protein